MLDLLYRNDAKIEPYNAPIVLERNLVVGLIEF